MTKLLDLLQSGQEILAGTANFEAIHKIVDENLERLQRYNYQNLDAEEGRQLLSEITGQIVPKSVTVSRPFHTDFGRHIRFGEEVFINADVSMTDLGGIILEDKVLIGPKAILATVNHLENPDKRRGITAQPIRIRKNAWIGAGATILPGVTIGENAIVSAGAVVTKDVPDNSIAAGVPARVIRPIRRDNQPPALSEAP